MYSNTRLMLGESNDRINQLISSVILGMCPKNMPNNPLVVREVAVESNNEQHVVLGRLHSYPPLALV